MTKYAFAESGPVSYSPQEDMDPDRLEAETVLLSIPGVNGVGEGRNAIGDPAWIAYIRDPSIANELPRSVGSRPIVTEVSGDIDILPA